MALLPGSTELTPRDTVATDAQPVEEPRKGKVWVNVTPEEEQLLVQWAARAGKPLAVLVREAALAAAGASR